MASTRPMMELVGARWAILQTLHRSTASLIMVGEDIILYMCCSSKVNNNQI